MKVALKGAAAVSIVVLVVGLGANVAVADPVFVRDAKETDAFLDLAGIKIAHKASDHPATKFRHTITTHERWRSRRLCDSHIRVYIRDTGRHVEVFWKKGLRARVVKEPNHVVAQLRVWRPDSKSVRVVVRRRHLGFVGDSYRWRAASSSAPCRCNDTNACPAYVDVAPERRWARHDL